MELILEANSIFEGAHAALCLSGSEGQNVVTSDSLNAFFLRSVAFLSFQLIGLPSCRFLKGVSSVTSSLIAKYTLKNNER